MFKTHLITLLLVVASLQSLSQHPAFTLNDSIATIGYGPNSRSVISQNNIEKTLVTRCDYKSSKLQTCRLFQSYVYDDKGKMIKEQMLSKEGVAGSTTFFTYDETSKLAVERLTGNDGATILEFIYDNGTQISRDYSTGKVRVDTSYYFYDSKHRLLKVTYTFGSDRGYYTYKYDENGRIENVSQFDKEGSKSFSRKYKYSEGRKANKVEVYREDKRFKYKMVECVYNRKGQCESCVRYTKQNVLEKYTYNSNGTMESCVIDYGNNFKTIYKYEYLKRQ